LLLTRRIRYARITREVLTCWARDGDALVVRVHRLSCWARDGNTLIVGVQYLSCRAGNGRQGAGKGAVGRVTTIAEGILGMDPPIVGVSECNGCTVGG
jgi:hypothetical protein